MPPRKRLGQLLTELHVVDEHQLHSALGHQKQWGGKLGAILVQKGFCKEEQVVSALATHLGMPVVRLSTQKVDPRAVKLVTRPIAEKLHVFAYEITGSGRGEVVTIAMSDPTDLSAVDQLAFHTGKRIKPMLCGDSEIVNAIMNNYGDSQPAPAAAGAAPAKPAAMTPQAAAPSATTPFPRRIELHPAPAPLRAPSPYIPPPIPARPARPMQPLEEIEPVDADSFANVAAAPSASRPEPLELPESDGAADGPMEGLEPIAAHVQSSGEEVTGQEDVAGDGTAGDALEGLEAASEATRHEGSEHAPLEGLEGSAAQPMGSSWDSTASSEWGAAPEGGWDAAPAANAEPAGEAATPAEPGWGEAAPEAPQNEFEEAQDWAATPEAPDVAWETAQPEWGAGEQAEAEPVATAEEPVSEELPADAIIGTADALEEGTESWAEDAPAEELVSQEELAHDEHAVAEPGVAQEQPALEEQSLALEQPAPQANALEEHGAAPLAAPEHAAVEPHEAEAPDAWATSEDPLAAGQEIPAKTDWGAPAPQEPPADAEQAWTAVKEWSAQEPEPGVWAETEEEPAPEQEVEQPATVDAVAGWPEEAAGEQPSHEPIAAAEDDALTEPLFEGHESATAPQFAEAHAQAGEPGDATKDHLPAAQEPAFGDQGEAHSHGEDQIAFGDDEPARHAAADGESVADGSAHAPAAAAAETAADGPMDERLPEELPANDAQAAGEEFAVFQDETPEEQAAGETGSGEPLLEGWVAPPPEPPAVGAGWLGEALAATTPLSAADLETLSTVGVDVNDGVGAFRLLAALLRVLQRRNAIDFDELAGELAQSRSAATDVGPAEQPPSEEAL